MLRRGHSNLARFYARMTPIRGNIVGDRQPVAG